MPVGFDFKGMKSAGDLIFDFPYKIHMETGRLSHRDQYSFFLLNRIRSIAGLIEDFIFKLKSSNQCFEVRGKFRSVNNGKTTGKQETVFINRRGKFFYLVSPMQSPGDSEQRNLRKRNDFCSSDLKTGD